MRVLASNIRLVNGERETHGTEADSGKSGGCHARDIHDRLKSHSS